MSGAKKIHVWNGATESYRFTVDVFNNEEQGLFIARTVASNLSIPQSLRHRGKSPARVSHHQLPTISFDDLDILKAQTRKAIETRYGAILKFQETELK